jgi:hypothetical protein
MWKAAANWYKIDGEWYFFLADGTLATNQFVGPDGDYYVDENGAWVEGVTGGWVETEDGWMFGTTIDGETFYYAEDDEAFDNGWYWINGKEYHFNEFGILDTWKVIKTPVFKDGKLVDWDVYGVGKNGNKGTVTFFDFIDSEIPVTVQFKFANSKEKKAAAKELKDIFTKVYGSMGDAYWTGNSFKINGEWYDVEVHRNTHAGDETEYDKDGNAKPKKATIDVFIDGVDIEEFIKNTEGGTFDVSLYGDISEVLGWTRVMTEAAEYDYKIVLGTDAKKDPIITDIAFNGDYLNVVVDGTEYQALVASVYKDDDWDDTEDLAKAKWAKAAEYVFLGDVTHKLGDKLAAKGIVEESITFNTATDTFGDIVTYEKVVEKDDDGDEIVEYDD